MWGWVGQWLCGEVDRCLGKNSKDNLRLNFNCVLLSQNKKLYPDLFLATKLLLLSKYKDCIANMYNTVNEIQEILTYRPRKQDGHFSLPQSLEFSINT